MIDSLLQLDSTDLKLMKSAWLANVMTLFASSLGTGNNALKIAETLSPNSVEKPSNINCGNCSETVLVELELTSWRRVTLWSVSDSVGPCGR